MPLFRKPKKLEVSIRKVDEIPTELMRVYAKHYTRKYSIPGKVEDYVPANTPQRVEEAEVKIGAFHNGKMIGFIAAHPKKSHFDYKDVLAVRMVYVRRGHRKSGVGKRLVARLFGEAKKAGKDGVDTGWMTFGMHEQADKWAKRYGHSVTVTPDGYDTRVRFKRPRERPV